jgi:hypothetical protein
VWFHNVSFRNGVFEAVGDRVNPLFHLAKIFAAMRYTRRPVVDPGALIEALRLNKGAQQDAAEFSKLFMDLIEKQFKAQGGPLADFVSEQFAGQLEYRTKCNRCGYTSSTTSPFMELEIPLRDGCTLEDQLRNMLTPELLDGDNKYRCPQCTSLQPATRSTHLQHLPPALHFALNRFEYTPTSDERKKSKARIYYPHKLRLANVDYDLHGVVVHEGPKASQPSSTLLTRRLRRATSPPRCMTRTTRSGTSARTARCATSPSAQRRRPSWTLILPATRCRATRTCSCTSAADSPLLCDTPLRVCAGRLSAITTTSWSTSQRSSTKARR